MSAQDDMEYRQLLKLPAFRNHLLRIYRLSGIGIPANGADQVLSYREGQRSLGLEILRKTACGLPRGSGVDQVLALILSEAQTPTETDDDDRSRYLESQQ